MQNSYGFLLLFFGILFFNLGLFMSSFDTPLEKLKIILRNIAAVSMIMWGIFAMVAAYQNLVK